MKNVAFIISIFITIFMFSSCQKEDLIEPSDFNQKNGITAAQPCPDLQSRNNFTGVVFSQDDWATDSLVRFDVKRISSDSTNVGPSWLYSNTAPYIYPDAFGNGFPVVSIYSSPGTPELTVYDSIPMIINSGDSLFIGAYKTTDENVIGAPLIPNYGVKAKVYVSGVLIMSFHSNYIQEWFSIP